MIGKNVDISDKSGKSNGSRMGAICEYIEKADEHEQVTDVWHLNAFSNETADIEMCALADANARSKNPMRHIVLSWKEGEIPTPEQAREAANIALEEMGLKDCLAKCAVHKDTDNLHLHIAVCTVNPDTLKMVKTEWIQDRIHRSLAVIEHKQGWKREDHAIYQCLENGKPVKSQDYEREAKKLSDRAEKKERHTGQRSAQDIAIEEVSGAVKNKGIKTWQQFHETLAQSGLTYERKGSGAVVGVKQDQDMIYVKASEVYRGAALSKLVKQYGAFEAAKELTVAERKTEPSRNVVAGNRTELWNQFKDERDNHAGNKSAAWNSFRAEFKQRRDELRDKQKSERSNAYEGIKIGREAMIATQSVFAALHAGQKAELRDEQTKRRSELVERYKGPPPRDFAVWLEKKNELSHAQEQRHPVQESNGLIGAHVEPEIKRDIRHYEAIKSSGASVGYANKETGDIDFTDHGSRLTFNDSTKADAIRAGVQLAAEKWKDGFVLSGDNKFKESVCREAVALGLGNKITNPEMQDYLEKCREQQQAAEQNKNAEHRKEFKVFDEAVKADRYRVTVTHTDNAGKEYTSKLTPIEGLPADRIPWDQIDKNVDKKQINVTPLSEKMHHLVLDCDKDAVLDPQVTPAATVVDGQRQQIVLNIPKVSDDARENDWIERAMSTGMGSKEYRAGVKMPGVAGAKLADATGAICHALSDKAKALRHQQDLDRITKEKKNEAEREMKQNSAEKNEPPFVHGMEGRIDRAFGALQSDIIKHQTRKDVTRVDLMTAQRLRSLDYKEKDIKDCFVRAGRPEDFSTRTAAAAFNKESTATLQKLEKSLPKWKEIVSVKEAKAQEIEETRRSVRAVQAAQERAAQSRAHGHGHGARWS